MTDLSALKTLIETIVAMEMPIANIKHVGNWNRGSSFRHPVDRALLTSPRGLEKINRQWQRTPYVFDMYLVNDPRVNKQEFIEVGEVSEDFVREKMKLTPEEFPGRTPGVITIIFTNNRGNRRYMASGWILAHRFGHALWASQGQMGKEWLEYTRHLRTVFRDMLSSVYDVNIGEKDYVSGDDVILRLAAHQVGTMKSAREASLNNWYEFAYELFAQYLLTGKITLNPLPDTLVTKLEPFGRKRLAKADKSAQKMYNTHDLDYYAGELEQFMDNILDMAQGRIFVM